MLLCSSVDIYTTQDSSCFIRCLESEKRKRRKRGGMGWGGGIEDKNLNTKPVLKNMELPKLKQHKEQNEAL